MTLRHHATLTADGRQAQAELRRTGAEAERLGSTLQSAGRDGADAGRAIQGAAAGSGQLAQQSQLAAGSVGNLVANFNDIGMMLMAGQSPLMLAVQQGTAITQVIGPMGAAGAARALSTAFVSMLSPINLITLGGIAAGAAVIQWLTGASEKAQTFDDRLGTLSDALSEYRERGDVANATTEEMEKRFGSAAVAARGYFAQFSETSLRGMQQAAKAAIATLVEESGVKLRFDKVSRREVGELFDLGGLQNIFRSSQDAIDEVIASYALLDKSAKGTTDQQIEAAQRLREALVAGSNLTGGITEQENARITEVEALIERLLEVHGQEPDPEREAARARAAWAQYYNSRMQAERQLAETARQKQLAEAYGPYQSSRTASDAALRSGQELLTQLQAENNLRQIGLTYGKDSVQYTEAQADAQRAAFEEVLASMDVAESLKEELRGAFEQGQALANANMSGTIWDAANAAAALATNLANARAQGIADMQRAQIEWDYRDDPVGKAGALAGARLDAQIGKTDTSGLDPILQQGLKASRQEVIDTAEAVETLRQKTIEYGKEQAKVARGASGGGSGRKRGGKSAAKEERDDVAELLKDYDQRLAILRETDPVQQELLRHSEALSKASAAEVAGVRSKIEQLQQEETIQQRIKSLQDFSGQLAMAGLDAMRQKGDAAAQAWQQVGQMVQQAVMQAVVLGDGPLGGMLGGGLIPGLFSMFTGGGGGLLTGLFGLFGKRADGGMAGMIYGQGGSRDDKVPVLTSPLEFIVNAQATARHRGLLEAINSGSPLPRFANGGAVGGGTPFGWSDGAPQITINNNSSAQVTAHDDGRDAQGRRKVRFEMAEVVGGAMRVRGGGAARQLASMGLRQTGPRR